MGVGSAACTWSNRLVGQIVLQDEDDVLNHLFLHPSRGIWPQQLKKCHEDLADGECGQQQKKLFSWHVQLAGHKDDRQGPIGIYV